MVQGYLEQQKLHYDMEEGLDEQRGVESCAGVVEDPVGGPGVSTSEVRGPAVSRRAEQWGLSHLKKEATSMMSGMSREKPALDLLRCIATAWSPYERMGEKIRNRGAT